MACSLKELPGCTHARKLAHGILGHRMTAADVVGLPLWLVIAGAALALWSVFDRMLVPSVRWFVRRRLNRVIDDPNARLQFQIPRFASTRRQVLIDRLTYDPEVLETVDRQASASGTPRDVLTEAQACSCRAASPSLRSPARHERRPVPGSSPTQDRKDPPQRRAVHLPVDNHPCTVRQRDLDPARRRHGAGTGIGR